MIFSQRKHGIGRFRSRQRAIKAFDELKNSGFPMNKISVLAQKPVRNDPLSQVGKSELTLTPGEGAAAGAVVGATIGGSLALVAGLGALLVPGFGQALAVESLFIALVGSGASAAAGGLVGALRGWFLPEEVSLFYNNHISSDVYLVTVQGTENEIRHAESILTSWGIQEWRIIDASNNRTER
ncbi:MAG: hypothetical protein AB1589_03840 [Cyanobacteriota bacterium]